MSNRPVTKKEQYLAKAADGGDFTTAEVTIRTDSLFSSAVIAMIPCRISADDFGALLPSASFDASNIEETLSVVLYKGEAYAQLWDIGNKGLYDNVTFSGDITEEDGGYLIAGPGTITLHGNK